MTINIKNLYNEYKTQIIIGVGFTVLFVIGLMVNAFVSNQPSNQNPQVLGATEEEVRSSSKRDITPLIPLPNRDEQIKTTSPLGELELNTNNYELSGDGCILNDSEKSCIVINSNTGSTFELKNCATEGSQNCSFYTYSLGRETDFGVYIFQSFYSGNQELTDVLSYNEDTNSTELLETVLYENLSNYTSCENSNDSGCVDTKTFDIDPNSLSSKVQSHNNYYVDTINKYK